MNVIFSENRFLGKPKDKMSVSIIQYVSCCLQYLLHTSNLHIRLLNFWHFHWFHFYGCWVLLALANSIKYFQHWLIVTLLCLCFCKTCQIWLGMIWIFQVKWALEVQLCILLAFNSNDEYSGWLQHCKWFVFDSIDLIQSNTMTGMKARLEG